VDQASTSLDEAATNSESKVSETTSQVIESMGETGANAKQSMREATAKVEEELNNTLGESRGFFSTSLSNSTSLLSNMVNEGIGYMGHPLGPLAGKAGALMSLLKKIASVITPILDFLSGFWDGIVEWFTDMVHGIGTLLSKWWDGIKSGDPLTWILTIVVI